MRDAFRVAATFFTDDTSADARRRRFIVLVVEDNHDHAESLAVLIRLLERDAVVTSTGDHAIAVAKALQPRLVLLDIGLPGLDGCEVARLLRQVIAAHTKIVAVTAHGEEETRRRCVEAGIDEHFVKPIALRSLRRLLLDLDYDEAR